MKFRVSKIPAGKVIYLQRDEQPSPNDLFVGTMENRYLAELVVGALNHAKLALLVDMTKMGDKGGLTLHSDGSIEDGFTDSA